ncbi:MAG: aminoacyl-tRNA hydrolase [Pirellulaceae bacterium]|nr:aminoacyl-tRNA hydrolase [Pirellulaceae bacterium]
MTLTQKLVVGLGNPGAKYVGTRHNIGFDVLDALCRKLAAPPPRVNGDGKTSSIALGSDKLLLVWPQTYMNHSGRCVRRFAQFYKTDIHSDLLVICDDLSLPVGKVRVRPQGSAGGQKGLADILQQLGSLQIPRLRIGIGAVPDHWDGADYVLSRFRDDERPVIAHSVERACSAIEAWCQHDLQYCMNHFNS